MEKWKDIVGFPGYQVSNYGNVRSFWRKKRCETGYGTYRVLVDTPYMLPQSDDGNGYMKVTLKREDDPRNYCRKVHRLVAEAFLPRSDHGHDTVDHIMSGANGKLDNSVTNLRWLSRQDNIRKAYRDGVCDERIRLQNKPIIAIDLWTGKESYFHSIGEAATYLRVDRSGISHVLLGDCGRVGHYRFEYAGREDRLLYGWDD